MSTFDFFNGPHIIELEPKPDFLLRRSKPSGGGYEDVFKYDVTDVFKYDVELLPTAQCFSISAWKIKTTNYPGYPNTRNQPKISFQHEKCWMLDLPCGPAHLNLDQFRNIMKVYKFQEESWQDDDHVTKFHFIPSAGIELDRNMAVAENPYFLKEWN